MAFVRRSVVQQKDLFVLAEDMPRSDGHIFYTKANRLLEIPIPVHQAVKQIFRIAAHSERPTEAVLETVSLCFQGIYETAVFEKVVFNPIHGMFGLFVTFRAP